MGVQPMIVTTSVLVELEDVVWREDLLPFDPWGPPPDYPKGGARAVILHLDGTISREVDVDVIEWRDVAGYRFETDHGQSLLSWTEADDYY